VSASTATATATETAASALAMATAMPVGQTMPVGITSVMTKAAPRTTNSESCPIVRSIATAPAAAPSPEW
jgi:hypothetical protein